MRRTVLGLPVETPISKERAVAKAFFNSSMLYYALIAALVILVGLPMRSG